jgi:hypothetical protein
MLIRKYFSLEQIWFECYEYYECFKYNHFHLVLIRTFFLDKKVTNLPAGRQENQGRHDRSADPSVPRHPFA